MLSLAIWMHEISISKTVGHHFWPGLIAPHYKLGVLIYCRHNKIICCWFHFWFLPVPLWCQSIGGQGKAEICPGGSHYHPDGTTASHPPFKLNGVFQFELVYSKLLMLVAGADEIARLPLSHSPSFPTQPSKHNTTFPPSKRVHERSLNNEQKDNSPLGPPTHGVHSPYPNHSEPSLLPLLPWSFRHGPVCL
jgi:hypothetical protein